MTAGQTHPDAPSWADPTLEILDTADRVSTPRAFVRSALAHLAALGITGDRAYELVAHCGTECSWGRRAIGDNRGGVKLKHDDDAVHRRAHGVGLRWWRHAGHVASGDAPVVYYRGFDDEAAFWRFFLRRYCPEAGLPCESPRYGRAGLAFWGGAAGRWFVELLLAGYRGEVRQAEIERIIAAGGDVGAHPSVAAHHAAVAQVRALATERP